MSGETEAKMGRMAALGLLAAVLVSYVAAFGYTRWCLVGLARETVRIAYPIFATVFVCTVEFAARVMERKGPAWHWFWAACWLVLSASIGCWGFHPFPIGLWEVLVWHALAIYWVLARSGVLGEGRSGIMLPLDFFLGSYAGLANMPLRTRSVRRSITGLRGDVTAAGAKRLSGIVASLFIAAGVSLVAWALLASGDAKFASFTDRLGDFAFKVLDWIVEQISGITLVSFMISIPAGAWLFGLVGGNLRRGAPFVRRPAFDRFLGLLPRLPRAAAVTVPLSLLILYLVFFGVQAADFSVAVVAGEPMSARRACVFAVDGFWYLFWIMVLDFAILGALHYLCGNVSKEKRAIRILLAAFLVAGFAVGLLGGWKLWNYIQLGLTPRRLLSAWFLCVMMVWNALAFARLFVSFQAVRWAICTIGALFTLLCAIPVLKICVIT